jgi:hypothetical protein
MSFCSTSPLQCSFLPWWDCLQCYLWVSDIPYKILVRNLMTGVWWGRWRPWWEERIRATQIWRSRTSIQGTFVSFCFFNLLSCYSICYYSVDFRPDNRAYELKHTGSLHFAFDLTFSESHHCSNYSSVFSVFLWVGAHLLCSLYVAGSELSMTLLFVDLSILFRLT